MIDQKTAERLVGQVWANEGGTEGAIKREQWLRQQRHVELASLHDTLSVLRTVVGRVLAEKLTDVQQGP